MENRKLKTIGHWYSWQEPNFPFPQDLAGEYEPGVKAKVLQYLNDERHSREADRGSSHCRFENCDGLHGDGTLGNLNVSDGTWIWPEGLRHYVEVHDVLLPPAFIKDAQEEPRPSDVSFAGKHAVDEWKEWAASCGTGDLRKRVDQAMATFVQWEAQQGSEGAAAYSPDPARGITKSLTEGALAQWVWTGGPLPALP